MSPQMKKMLLTVGIVFGLVFGWYGTKKILFWIFVATYTPPPVTISATTANAGTWQSFLTSVGTITAVNGVDISSETSGSVKEIHFQSGQFVNQGDLLILLDTSVEEAQLKDNQARLKLAQINYDRDKTLRLKNVASQAAVDTDLANLQQAQAGVEATQARINQKTVTAPFSGKIGIRQINIGEYVPAGTSMVTLQSLDPLYVRFNLPEQYLTELYLNQPVDIEVNLNTTDHQVIRGAITAINAKVDQTTRNILIQASIPNKKLQLYPGMFAQVRIWLHERNHVITLPQTAISYSLHGDSVFLIHDKGKKKHPNLFTTRQYVKVGERRGNDVVVLEGIKVGDRVATSGQLKLENDTHVVIDNSVEM